MLDAFDFTIFFLVMVAISQEFNVPLTLVAGTVTFTLWLRLVGAFASGWLLKFQLVTRAGYNQGFALEHVWMTRHGPLALRGLRRFPHALPKKSKSVKNSRNSRMNFRRKAF